MILPNILQVLPYNTAASHHRIEIVLKNLQAFTAHHTSIVIPDIKSTNEVFHQQIPLIPFEPILATKVQ